MAGDTLVPSKTEKKKMCVMANAGSPSHLTLYARDLRGNLIYRCGDSYNVRLRPRSKGQSAYVGMPVEQQGHCTDHGDGLYTVGFTPVVEGQYHLEITDTRYKYVQ